MNEQTIQMIAQAIIANTKVLQSLVDSLPQEAVRRVAIASDATPVAASAPAPVAQPEPVKPAPVAAPVVEAPAPVAAPVAAAPAMPAPPTFVAPTPAAPAHTGAPFSDAKGLIDYVMGAYKELGPTKGAQIQNVLTGLGYQNINDVKPEHYGALFQGVEQLKAA